jgi:hypothetical protein
MLRGPDWQRTANSGRSELARKPGVIHGQKQPLGMDFLSGYRVVSEANLLAQAWLPSMVHNSLYGHHDRCNAQT